MKIKEVLKLMIYTASFVFLFLVALSSLAAVSPIPRWENTMFTVLYMFTSCKCYALNVYMPLKFLC